MAYRVLSLSGGGVRGIFQAVYLHRMASVLGPISSRFDLIAGTSTGALVGLALALDIDLQQMIDLFQKHGPRIFPRRRLPRLQRLIDVVRRGPRYDVGPLRAVLTDVFGDRRLGECRPPVLITATGLHNFGHRLFTTLPELSRTESPDADLAVRDVALATSAAPTYFPSATPRADEGAYVDGGLWANNPALVAVLYAHRRRGFPLQDIRLVIVGNGEVPEGLAPVHYDRAPYVRQISTSVDLMFAAQTTAAEHFAEVLVKKSNVFRVNVTLAQPIPLDDSVAACQMLPPLAQELARRDRESLPEFLDRPPAPDLQLLELEHVHRYGNDRGDFEGQIRYTVRNEGPIPISELLPEFVTFFGTLPKPPDGPVTVIPEVVASPGPASLQLEHFDVRHVSTQKFDGTHQAVTRFYVNPRLTPGLAPGTTLTYALRFVTRETERAAFEPSGSYAGFNTRYPTSRLRFRCEAPEGYRFSRAALKHFLRTPDGIDVQVPRLPEPTLDASGRILTWEIAGGEVRLRVNYLVALSFEKKDPAV